ncbi:DUF2281 domain-containing protein [Candidatus Methylospira mobilis]|uniref:DUF2281 domain-containing protein n=1 Tax=Candidatus Methylospira mobilis TaxID=1808979 RepID=UPI0028EA8985|nr:DUF2281 domain-containing protein [Candidatus Methylospira mobilis]WNV04105.1 DUF2281 domain-containing protein [Candidatus Methylospira mobilis]
MSGIAEKIFEAVKTLPDQQAAEVLDFAEFLKARQASQRTNALEESSNTDDWSDFEQFAGAWSGKFNREDCYDRSVLR